MSRKRDPMKVGRYAMLASDPSKPSHYIRAWRLYRGLTQKELADLMNTTTSAISKYELGDQPYTQRVIERFADIFGCTPAELIGSAPPDAGDLVSNLRELPEDMQRSILSALNQALAKSRKIQK